jgi:hypothetical protein
MALDMTELNQYACDLLLLTKRFPPLKHHYVDVDGGPVALLEAYKKKESIPVYTGDSEGTIWGAPHINWLFRAHHDSLHLTHELPFTILGEYMASEIHSALAELMGLKELAIVMRLDVAGFAAYEADTGKFAPQGLSRSLLEKRREAVQVELLRKA